MKFNELLVGAGGWDPQVAWPWGFIKGMSYIDSTASLDQPDIQRTVILECANTTGRFLMFFSFVDSWQSTTSRTNASRGHKRQKRFKHARPW